MVQIIESHKAASEAVAEYRLVSIGGVCAIEVRFLRDEKPEAHWYRYSAPSDAEARRAFAEFHNADSKGRAARVLVNQYPNPQKVADYDVGPSALLQALQSMQVCHGHSAYL